MRKFSDLVIQDSSSKIFECKQVSISELVNCEIEVLDFQQDVKTSFGEGRCVVKVRHEAVECKFFTNSNYIKTALCAIDRSFLPFTTTVKSIKIGLNNSFRFT